MNQLGIWPRDFNYLFGNLCGCDYITYIQHSQVVSNYPIYVWSLKHVRVTSSVRKLLQKVRYTYLPGHPESRLVGFYHRQPARCPWPCKLLSRKLYRQDDHKQSNFGFEEPTPSSSITGNIYWNCASLFTLYFASVEWELGDFAVIKLISTVVKISLSLL